MTGVLRTYEQAIEFLFGRINYERAAEGASSARHLDLDRMRQLLDLIGRPQERLPVLHIAGTKGKGSTSVMAAEMLSAAGYCTGLFTSPHISAFEERIKVNGHSPTAAQLVELINVLLAPIEQMDRDWTGRGPTYFEIATALAWLYFLDRGAHIAVLEVGLGGRLDATNVCRPLATVVTNISRDHMNVLGSSIAQIAREKAGIVKPGVPVISGVAAGPAAEVVEEVCRVMESPLYRLGREIRWRPSDPQADCAPAVLERRQGTWHIDVDSPWGAYRGVPVALRGVHQGANAALAVASIAAMRDRGIRVSEEAVAVGMRSVRWPARIEVIAAQPTVVVDAAHNWASTEALLETLDAEFSVRRRTLVFAGTRDKDVNGLLRLLVPRFDTLILTQYHNNPRCVSAAELAAMIRATSQRPFHVASDAASAWRLARRIATPSDLICVTGSFFIAAELRELILGRGSADAGDDSHESSEPPAWVQLSNAAAPTASSRPDRSGP